MAIKSKREIEKKTEEFVKNRKIELDRILYFVKNNEKGMGYESAFSSLKSMAAGLSDLADIFKQWANDDRQGKLEESTTTHKTFRKYLKESAGQKLNITLIRKPSNMKEVESEMRKGHGDRVKAIVDKSHKLSENEYDKFVYNFNVHTTYLSGEGGVDSDGTVHVIEITAPARKTIYVDPEGYDYARYVGW